MSVNKLFIAAAGSGKTTLLVDGVLKNQKDKILITTFTLANKKSIYEKILKSNSGYVPSNVAIQTWFSFLIEHGVRPYRFWNGRVVGLHFVSSASGFRYKQKNGTPVYFGERDFFKYYFNSNMDVYSDKLARLVCLCNEKSNGCVIKRIEQIYNHIYIDEVQDMAGWDLELIKLFMKSSINLTIVGDPRQTVYLTHHDKKYQKYAYGKIKDFILNECKNSSCVIDEVTLKNSYRNTATICSLASKLYMNLPICESNLSETNLHMGIFFIHKNKVKEYYTKFRPMQLRYNKKTELYVDADCMNFGESKGLEYNHVLIYPTKNMLEWLCGQNVSLEDKTKAQLYVALTRAFFSVGIVVEDDFSKTVSGIAMWSGVSP